MHSTWRFPLIRTWQFCSQFKPAERRRSVFKRRAGQVNGRYSTQFCQSAGSVAFAINSRSWMHRPMLTRS